MLCIALFCAMFFNIESNAQSIPPTKAEDSIRTSIEGLSILPAPVKSGEPLHITSDSKSSKIICVYNNLGEKILFKVMTDSKLDTSDLNPGIHIIQVTEDGVTATRKLVVN